MWSLEITLGLEVAIQGWGVMEFIVPLAIHVFPAKKGG